MKYDSQKEAELYNTVFSRCVYHADTIKYYIEREYTPDFCILDDGIYYLIEVKGYFRSREESQKYLWIKDQLPPNWKLVFYFLRPKNSMPGSKKREDGTRQTMAEWAERNGFTWYTWETVPEGWGDERP